MVASIFGLILAIIPLVTLIIQEFLSASARAKAANEKFELDQANLKKLVDSAVEKWVARNAVDSKDAGDSWDKADRDQEDHRF